MAEYTAMSKLLFSFFSDAEINIESIYLNASFIYL